MAYNANTFGYIIDPLVPVLDVDGKPLVGGYIKVYMAGSSTPVLTHNNWDNEYSYNEVKIPLDISGRTFSYVIGMKTQAYKVLVCDASHDESDPIKTIDKIIPMGANVTADEVVQGLNNVSANLKTLDVSVTDNVLNITDKELPAANSADIAAGNYFVLDTPNGSKKLGADNLAKEASIGVYSKNDAEIDSSGMATYYKSYPNGISNAKIVIAASKECQFDSILFFKNGWTKLSEVLLNNVRVKTLNIPAGTDIIQIYDHEANSGENVTLEICSGVEGEIAENRINISKNSAKIEECNVGAANEKMKLFDEKIIVNEGFRKTKGAGITLYTGGYYNGSGTLVQAEGYKYSDFIQVFENAEYTLFADGYMYNTNQPVLFYDANKTLIGNFSGETNVKTRTFTTPFGCKYIKFSAGDANKQDVYVQYDGDDFSLASVVNECCESTSFVIEGTTLYNERGITIHEGGYINNAGTFFANDGYKYSDFITALPSANYKLFSGGKMWNTNQAVCFYNLKKEFIGSYAPNSNDDYREFETPEKCFYIRFSSGEASRRDFYLIYKDENPRSWANEAISELEKSSNEVEALPIEKIKLYGIQGRKQRVYFDNIFQNVDDIKIAYCSNVNTGRNYTELENDSAGESSLSVAIGNATKTVSRKVVSTSSKSGENSKVLIIGDSYTGNYALPARLKSLLEADAMNATTIGTLDGGIHEGYVGWATRDFWMTKTFNGNTNKFINPSAENGRFDFSYYLTSNGFDTPKYVVIELGINDIWRCYGDSVMYLTYMIQRIHAVSSSIKIILTGTSVFYFGKDSSNYSTADRRKLYGTTKAIINAFAGKENENVFVVPMLLNFDPIYSFNRQSVAACEGSSETVTYVEDTVHPTSVGYNMIAETLFAAIKSI